MGKIGAFEWFKDKEEKKIIKSTNFENSGKDDEFEKENEIHNLTKTNSKKEGELLNDKFSFEGKLTQDVATGILEELNLEYKKIESKLFKNKEELEKIIKQEEKIYNASVNFEKKMLEEKDLSIQKTLKMLRDTTFEAFENLEKINEETKKILLHNEKELNRRMSLFKEYYNVRKNVINPRNPEMN